LSLRTAMGGRRRSRSGFYFFFLLPSLLAHSLIIVVILLQDYFFQTYNLRIEHSRLVGIRLSGKSGQDDIVPLELCRVKPGQLYRKKLPEELTRDMVEFSAVRPQDRQRMIQQAVRFFFSFPFYVFVQCAKRTCPGPNLQVRVHRRVWHGA
jgi:hypothetical protein